jgi:TPR repeat protein
LLSLNTTQVGELLENIKDQTTEGKAFYRYVLLKVLADNGRAEAQSILGGMFEIGEGVPLDRVKGLALLRSVGARGDADLRAEWSTYVSDL